MFHVKIIFIEIFPEVTVYSMSISSRSYSNDVIKYGDVEKEREIEKRLKELGLWESKVS